MSCLDTRLFVAADDSLVANKASIELLLLPDQRKVMSTIPSFTPSLLNQVRELRRVKHYGVRIEHTYLQ
jgi:hypothetical protein